LGEIVGCGRRVADAVLHDAIGHAEGGGFAQWCLRATFDQTPRRLPLRERSRIGEGGAAGNDGAGRLDVGTGVDEGIEGLDVVAAGGPVERRLGVRPGEPGVDVSPGFDQRGDGRRHVGEVARPVRRDVQQRARHPGRVVAAEPGAGETGVVGEELLQAIDVAGVDRFDDRDREWFLGVDGRHQLPSPRMLIV
jgi:hypothetical protein